MVHGTFLSGIPLSYSSPLLHSHAYASACVIAGARDRIRETERERERERVNKQRDHHEENKIVWIACVKAHVVYLWVACVWVCLCVAFMFVMSMSATVYVSVRLMTGKPKKNSSHTVCACLDRLVVAVSAREWDFL